VSGANPNRNKNYQCITDAREKPEQHISSRSIWPRRYWEHLIRDEEDYARHVDYIHYNPVKHGYVKLAADWIFSSIHRYIRAGTLPRDWGSGKIIGDGNFGER
jgi:putative transposase